ncbi:MAG: hypothetical protein QME81_11645 [bacterium]|nr:hypothetical protein [bacterium]
MVELNDLKSAFERLAAGASNEADLQALRQAIQSGQITLATGERAVAIGGDATGVSVITGDNNVLLSFRGADAATIQQAQAAIFPPRLYQLPADLADFTGRGQEVDELCRLLNRGDGNVVISAIGGMGGVGKSALAVHVAHWVKMSNIKDVV